jgi:hypothetical protein
MNSGCVHAHHLQHQLEEARLFLCGVELPVGVQINHRLFTLWICPRSIAFCRTHKWVSMACRRGSSSHLDTPLVECVNIQASWVSHADHLFHQSNQLAMPSLTIVFSVT